MILHVVCMKYIASTLFGRKKHNAVKLNNISNG